MDPVKGIGAYFALGSAGSPATVTDISQYLTSIQGSSSVGEDDATTFQPGIPVPLKKTVPSFADKGYAISGLIDQANVIDPMLSDLEGQQNISYEYGPEGSGSGAPKISGLCNIMGYSGPKAAVNGVQGFDLNLKVVTQARGTFS